MNTDNKSIQLRGGLRVSRLGLGLSRLHRMGSDRSRRALIHAALDGGITHFDTAPLYGDGLSERMLGMAVHECRGAVTIASKAGLLPRRWIGALGTAAWPLHAGRAALRRAGLIAWPRRSFSASTFRKSLASSLRALRTDYLDIFFLHDPELSEIEKNDELFEEMAKMKKAGAIRHAGISGSLFPEIISRFREVIDIVQTMESVWHEGSGLVPDLTFGVLGGVMRQESGASQNSASAALSRAFARRPNGAVVVGTTRIGHLKEVVGVASQFADARL